MHPAGKEYYRTNMCKDARQCLLVFHANVKICQEYTVLLLQLKEQFK